MYNAKIKQEYLDYKKETTQLANNLKNWFDYAEYFEEKYDRDLCNWSSPEILAFCKYLSTPKIKTLTLFVNTMKIYTDWCMANSLVLDNQNHWVEVDQESLYRCIDTERLSESYITRDELLENIDKLYNYSDKFIFLGTFEGMTVPEIASAKPADLYDGIMHCKTRDLTISPELEDIIINTTTETSYLVYKKNNRDRVRSMELCSGDEIVRGSESSGPSVNQTVLVSSRFRRASKYLELSSNLTMINLKESGRFEMIRGILKETGMTLKDYIFNKEARKEMEERYGKIQNLSSFVMVYKDII